MVSNILFLFISKLIYLLSPKKGETPVGAGKFLLTKKKKERERDIALSSMKSIKVHMLKYFYKAGHRQKHSEYYNGR